jgi:hypothetical protein
MLNFKEADEMLSYESVHLCLIFYIEPDGDTCLICVLDYVNMGIFLQPPMSEARLRVVDEVFK